MFLKTIFDISMFGLLSLMLSILLFHPTVYLAKRFNLMDTPEERKIHKVATPRIGGLMIFVSFFVIYVISEKYMYLMSSTNFSKPIFLISAILAFMLGFIDDLVGLRAYKKLIIQVLIGLMVAYSGLKFQTIYLMGLQINFGLFSYIITALWVVALFNAINLIDGMDGLASGIVIIALIFSLVVSII